MRANRITKIILEMTNDELIIIKDFISILANDDNLNCQETWDVMQSILNGDNETLNEYEYYLNIKNS